MEPDSVSRESLESGTSSNIEEKEVDTGSSKDAIAEDDVPPCHEDWETVYLKPGKEAPKKKLCGYLNKYSAKAPIKAWKSRWFFYDENKCHLLYYRTAQDMNPLGSIEISSASFDLKVGSDEGVFEIRTPSKDFILKAVNKQAMMYWLQQLQMKRWEFCKNQLRSFVEENADFSQSVNKDQLEDEHDFLPTVKTPTDVVGVKAASLPAPQLSVALQNISLKHPWIEIQNTVHNLCGSRQNRKDNGGMLDFEETQGPLENVTEEAPVEAEAEDTVRAEIQKDLRMRPKLSSFRRTKKMNSNFHYFAEGTGKNKVASLQHQVWVLTEDVKSQKGIGRQ